jgi:hypothetical protein
MKLIFQKAKEYKEHIDYIAQLPFDKAVHMVLPIDILRLDKIPYSFVAYCHTSSTDKTQHLCHKCNRLYPAHQYSKHAKEFHNG